MPTPSDRFTLVALDMNGTTVRDGGVFESSLESAFASIGAPVPDQRTISPLRGMSKRDLFRRLITDPAVAGWAYDHFVSTFLEAVASGAVQPVAGAAAVLESLHERGLRTCLIAGFPPVLQTSIVETLGWSRLIDLSVSSDDVARGRPHPDVIRRAAAMADVDRPDRVVVVGDTVNDLLAGERARAGLVVGVLTGSHDEHELRRVPAARIIRSVADLPDLVAAEASMPAVAD